MGGKSSRSRQQVYLCITLLSLFCGGCALTEKEVPKAKAPAPEVAREPRPLPEPPPIVEGPKETLEHREANESLTLAQNLMAKGITRDLCGKVKECCFC